jgi:hypothetical protein
VNDNIQNHVVLQTFEFVQRDRQLRPFESESQSEHNVPTHARQRDQQGLPGHSQKEKEHVKTIFRTMSLAAKCCSALPTQNGELNTTGLHTRDNKISKVCPGIRKPQSNESDEISYEPKRVVPPFRRRIAS